MTRTVDSKPISSCVTLEYTRAYQFINITSDLESFQRFCRQRFETLLDGRLQASRPQRPVLKALQSSQVDDVQAL